MLLRAESLTKSFGPVKVLTKADLQINKGDSIGLIGVNGAGKSTFLRMAAGVFRPDNGTITLDDMPVYENPAAKQEFFYISDKYADTPSTLASKRMIESAGIKCTKLETSIDTLTLNFRIN